MSHIDSMNSLPEFCYIKKVKFLTIFCRANNTAMHCDNYMYIFKWNKLVPGLPRQKTE